jgi:hypothetical protein
VCWLIGRKVTPLLARYDYIPVPPQYFFSASGDHVSYLLHAKVFPFYSSSSSKRSKQNQNKKSEESKNVVRKIMGGLLFD